MEQLKNMFTSIEVTSEHVDMPFFGSLPKESVKLFYGLVCTGLP